MQVQLAKDYDGRHFECDYFSRKFDGKRMYYHDGVGLSRDNILCRPAPIEHITEEVWNIPLTKDYILDGEVLYFENNFAERFKKAISLTSRIVRAPECENLKYVIFDIIKADDFVHERPGDIFKENYKKLCSDFEAREIPGRTDLLATKYDHIMIARQTPNFEELLNHEQYKKWEGTMMRNALAPYEYKRSGNLRKIKEWKDTELQLIGIKEGLGKYENCLGALLVNFKGHTVAVGTGLTDQDRRVLWEELSIGGRLYKDMVERKLWVKVKYFQESCDADGTPSLRFPSYICFRDVDLNDYVFST